MQKDQLKVVIYQEGDGKTFPLKGQKVHVHYIGTLKNGQLLDSPRDRNQYFIFQIGVRQVIKGWDEGISQMSLGSRAKITCPPRYAYGEKGLPDFIPPCATIIFDVEVFKITYP